MLAGDFTGTAAVIQRKGDAVTADAGGKPLTGASILSFSDPVAGASGKLACRIAVKGVGSAIEYVASRGSAPALLANVGSPAPGGGHWAAFSFLALPDGPNSAPLFTATLAVSKADGVTPQNKTGLWAVDSSGTLRLLLRPGRQLFIGSARKTVKSFTALVPAPEPEAPPAAVTTREMSPSSPPSPTAPAPRSACACREDLRPVKAVPFCASLPFALIR